MRSYPVLISALAATLLGFSTAQNLTSQGALQVSMNASSLQSLVDDFSVIVPDFIAANENFTFDLDMPSLLYDVKMTGVRVEQLVIEKKSVKIVPGAKFPSFEAELSGIDM